MLQLGGVGHGVIAVAGAAEGVSLSEDVSRDRCDDAKLFTESEGVGISTGEVVEVALGENIEE